MVSKPSLKCRRVLCMAAACLFALCLTACSRDGASDSAFAHTRDASDSASSETDSSQVNSSEQTDSATSDSADGEEAESSSPENTNQDSAASVDGQEDSGAAAQSVDGQASSDGQSASADGQTSKGDKKNAGSADGQEIDSADLDLSAIKDKGTVLVLDFCGTTSQAGSQDGEDDSDTKAQSSTKLKAKLLTKKEMASVLPELDDSTSVAVLQIEGVDSANLTGDTWIELAKLIGKAASNNKISGCVVVQGADTLDETAYFLNLTVKTDKAVLVTSASQESDSDSAARAKNLTQAIVAASDDDSQGKGVLEVFGSDLYASRNSQSTSDGDGTLSSSMGEGYLGSVHGSDAEFYVTPEKTHTLKSEFDIDVIEALPQVSIVQCNADADARLISDAAAHSDGLVVVGAADGSFSDEFKAAIDECTIPVIVCSGVDGGYVSQDSLQCEKAVAANNLSSEKAAVLLRLALTKTTNQDTLEEIFAAY